MTRPKKSNDYVDNEVLKELLQKYIESNPADQGQWLEKYEKTMRTRTQNKPDKWVEVNDFMEFRKALYASKRPLNEFQPTADKLIPMLYKIIDGRMASYKIFDNTDIKQDCMIALLKYMNRYDYRKDTSAFAYVSEIVTQAINLHLAKEKEAKLDGNLVYEHELFDTRGVDQMKGMDDSEENYE